MEYDEMTIAKKATNARAYYEVVKTDYIAANASVEAARTDLIEACRDVKKHWLIITLAHRILEKEAAADLAWRRFTHFGVRCDLAEDAARKEVDAA
jgi:tryptophan 2,3-dioxygenase